MNLTMLIQAVPQYSAHHREVSHTRGQKMAGRQNYLPCS